MDRKLVVTLLKNNIKELELITDGFMEMSEFPQPILQLARKKTEDILSYIDQLKEFKSNSNIKEDADVNVRQETVAVLTETSVLSRSENNITEQLVITEVKEEKGIEQEEIYIVEEQVINQEMDEPVPVEPDKNIDESVFEMEAEPQIATEIEEEPEVLDKPVEEEYKIVIEEKKIVQHIEIEKSTVADSHTHKKIADIRHAMSIGDQFRFQRELFNGNGELLSKTLSYLNELSDFDEAQAYLRKKFDWNEEDEIVESFYQIIKRRYP